MSARQATRKTLRAAIAFALTYLMVWGGMPAPALAEMAEEAMGEEPVASVQVPGRDERRGEAVAGGGAELAPEAEEVVPVEAAPTDELPVEGMAPQGEPGAVGDVVMAVQSTPLAGRLSNPRVVEKSGTSSGQVATWDCVWLGTYPQTEVRQGDAAYEDLASAEWADGDATVGGVRYRRIAKSDATHSYYWSDDGYGSAAYRYFRYEPVKWRVLKVDGGTALAVADVALDCRGYHKSEAMVTWETSTIRSWLNGTGAVPYYTSGAQSGRTARAFAEVAFTEERLGAVRQSTIANANGTYSNTPGGNDTSDRVFLLSEAEVHGAAATEHGFVSGPGTYDEARCCRATDFARAMGAYRSTSGSYAGNCRWWLRSPGGDASFAAYVRNDGDVHRYGYLVDYTYYAVRPALNLNLSSPHLAWAGTVSSDGAVDESRPIASVEVAETELTYDGAEKRPAVTVWSDGVPVPEAGYDLSYEGNVAAGTATVRATGKGVYEGEAQAAFEIARRPVTVTADDRAKALGDPDPELTATVDGTVGGDAVSYSVSREQGEALGEYAITPSGDAVQGNYDVTYAPGTLTIVPRNDVVMAEVAPIPDKTFTGSAIEPPVAVTLDGQALVAGTDYDVTYANNVKAGTATATITGKGGYVGTKVVEFRIAPKPVTVTAENKTMTYDEADPVFTATVNGLLGSDTVSYTLSREPGENAGEYAITPSGEAVQGNYAVTYVPGKLTIVAADISAAVVDPIAPRSSTGSPIEPKPVVRMGEATLEEGIDYDLSYENNVGPGAATVAIAGRGNYAGSKTAEFSIGEPTKSSSASGPRVVPKSGTSSGQVATWDCVWLGTYPQTEVRQGDAAYEDLASAEWADGDATVGGVRYRRIAKSDATHSYYWSDDGYGSAAYRYFRYEPVKWRVLKVDGGTALAVADVALDCRGYHKSEAMVTWETSTIRSWLNGTGAVPYYTSGAQSGRTARAFVEVAFTEEQLGAVRQSANENANNTSYGTAGGSDTSDRVFLLSESEVHGAAATAHGFDSSYSTYDEARRCRPTDFARAMGARVETSGSYAGNCWWWLRSPGNHADYAAGVYDDGCVDRGGYYVGSYDNAVRPALNLNLSSPHLAWAGTVSSDGAVDESRPIASVEVAETGLTYDGAEKRPAVTVWSDGVPVPEAGYDLSYEGNVAAGTATVRATGKGVYEGEAQAAFEIARRPVTVTADDRAKALGDPDPELTATVDGTVGGDAVSYSISRAQGEALGEYAITPTGEAI